MRCSVFVVVACSVGCAAAQSNMIILDQARRSLTAGADTIHTFDTENYVYHRMSFGDGASLLTDPNYSTELLHALIGDANPRVRTLAMALLFNKEEPTLLLAIAQHLSDTAETFPVLMPTANADPRATAPQTVGQVAGQLLGVYMMAAGMTRWRNPTFADWVAYNTAHGSRPYSLSWLIVRLSRITRMQSPFQEERRPLLLNFRKELDALPQDDRNLYLLWLCHGNRDFDGGRELATEAELVDAAKRLGRQKLLQIVDGRPPGTDPDIPAGAEWQNRARYAAVVNFILARADQLFTIADEPFLAAIAYGRKIGSR
jgi:hypothetical protein